MFRRENFALVTMSSAYKIPLINYVLYRIQYLVFTSMFSDLAHMWDIKLERYCSAVIKGLIDVHTALFNTKPK